MEKSKLSQSLKQEIKEDSFYSFLNISNYVDEDISILEDYFDFLYPHNNVAFDEEARVLSMRPNPQAEEKKISSITIRIRGE